MSSDGLEAAEMPAPAFKHDTSLFAQQQQPAQHRQGTDQAHHTAAGSEVLQVPETGGADGAPAAPAAVEKPKAPAAVVRSKRSVVQVRLRTGQPHQPKKRKRGESRTETCTSRAHNPRCLLAVP